MMAGLSGGKNLCFAVRMECVICQVYCLDGVFLRLRVTNQCMVSIFSTVDDSHTAAQGPSINNPYLPNTFYIVFLYAVFFTGYFSYEP